MPIQENEVIIGGKYRTLENQERVVIGCNADNKVVYASRGGNVKNAFYTRNSSSLERFADACSEKLDDLNSEQLGEIIQACNGQTEISINNKDCLKSTQ